MILLLNGAFGVGKTTVARLLVARMPRAVVFERLVRRDVTAANKARQFRRSPSELRVARKVPGIPRRLPRLGMTRSFLQAAWQ